MSKLLHISEAANLALHTAIYLGRNPGRKVSATEIAEAFGASKAHLSKVLLRLVQAGMVDGKRGPGGGYELARKASAVSLLQVYEAVEGKVRKSACMFKRKVCSEAACIMGGTLETVNELLTSYLRRTKLSDFDRK